ncbi:MAG: ABC transporter permease [Acidimicrobiales bacterium]|nr:ABC transporter permease [Acidimicrobiales bacterium]
MTWLDFKRRIRDKSAIITSFIAPFVLASILGLAFGNAQTAGLVRVGIVITNPNATSISIVNSGLAEAALPAYITVKRFNSVSQINSGISNHTIDAGIIVPGDLGSKSSFTNLLKNIKNLYSTLFVQSSKLPDKYSIAVISSGSSSIPNQVAKGIAATIDSRIYTGLLVAATTEATSVNQTKSATTTTANSSNDFLSLSVQGAVTPLPFTLKSSDFGSGKNIIGYFAPSMAIVFLFIGAGMGARGIVAERSSGTLTRLAAAPVKSGAVVVGKILSILVLSLVSVFLLWGETAVIFGASWGNPLGVALLIVATTLAMCGLSIFLTSLAKTEQQAFSASAIVGFALALLGGNFFPPGSLPPWMQTISLMTPNGWALVGFGRLSQEGLGLSGVLGPIEVLGTIALIFGIASLLRIGRVVEL